MDGLAYSIYLGVRCDWSIIFVFKFGVKHKQGLNVSNCFQGDGIKDDHLYELHLAEECNLSVDSVLFAKVDKILSGSQKVS